MNIFKNLAVMSIAAIMLIACGGDNGSSARDDEIDSSSSSEARSSSSSVKSSSSSDVILSGGSAAVEESSSSSVVKSSSSSARSSSSSRVILSSGDIESSGTSSPYEFLSSSEEESSSSAKSSSSSAKSSSSVKISSSSEYVPFDHSVFLSGVKYEDGVYRQFTDERNGRSYYYITITGKDTSGKANTVTVMAENLNIGEMVDGFDDQSDDAKIERYCYNDDTTYCDKYGGLYQWAEMMALPSECNTKSCADQIKENHQGICPTGWRLQTYNDMYTIVNADGNNHGIEGVRSAHKFGGYNTTGYSLVGAGYLWNFAFDGMNSSTYWHYPVERTEKRSNASWATNSSTDFQVASTNKTNGLSVRCVMVE